MNYEFEIEAIKNRHSVRQYEDKRMDTVVVQKLLEKIQELNQKGGLNIQLIEEAGQTFNKLLNRAMGLGSAPSVIACVGKDTSDLDERVGYYGEQLVLFAQQLGLNTCWAGTFNRKKIPAKIEEGERLVIVIAIGYGVNPGKSRKTKSAVQVVGTTLDTPDWFNFGVEMALLAPTAVNQQKFKIDYQDGEVIISDQGVFLGKVDLGIVKYHFEVGAEYSKSMAERKSLDGKETTNFKE